MFGYLGVLLASAAACSLEAGSDELYAILATATPPRLEGEVIVFGGRRFDVDAIRTGRSRGCRSIGSCSFDEPVEGARNLHLLT